MSNIKSISRGFTLIELIIVVVIVGILSAIVFPSYQAYVLKSGRADAKVELNTIAQRMQRCFTGVSTYKPAEKICAVVDEISAENGVISGEGQYAIKISDHDATTFTLTATPVSGERQAKDINCARYTLNQAGVRAAFNSSNTETTNECW